MLIFQRFSDVRCRKSRASVLVNGVALPFLDLERDALDHRVACDGEACGVVVQPTNPARAVALLREPINGNRLDLRQWRGLWSGMAAGGRR